MQNPIRESFLSSEKLFSALGTGGPPASRLQTEEFQTAFQKNKNPNAAKKASRFVTGYPCNISTEQNKKN